MQANMTTQYLHSIIDENQELRLRVSKLEEVQKYMEALLKRCQELQDQKRHFDFEMRDLIEQKNLLQKELKSIHENHKEEIKMVLLEHDSIMRQMQQELKVIRSEYERESMISDQLRQGNHHKENELRLLQQQFKAFTKQTDKQISQLRQELIINEKEYQFLAEEHKMSKSQFLDEKQALTKELYHLKAVVGRQMKRHIDEIESQNISLLKQNEGLKKYNEQIARNSTLREKQLAQEIKNLKIDFETKQNILNTEILNLQTALAQKTEQSSKRLNDSNTLIDENIHLKKELELSLSNENKFCFMLEESQKQNENLRQKLVEIDKYIKDETERYKEQFFEQRNHNNELRKVLSEKQMLMNEKLRQIKDLLSIIDEIESALKVKEKQIGLLNGELQTMEAQIKVHIKNYEERNLESRTLEQRNRSLKVSIEELQVLNGSLKKQILELETSIHSLKRELLNPRISSKESDEKIQSILENFRREKQIMYEEHQIEKSKMRETHEFEIKQKEFEFLRKIEYFQEEIKRLSR